MNRKSRKAARKPQQRSVWKSAPCALALTVAVGLLLLLLSTLALLCTKDPIRHTAIVGALLLYLCAAFGGAACTRLCGKCAPLLSGLLVGVGLYLVLALPALFFKGEASLAQGLLLRAPVVLTALGGAALGCREKKRRRRR